MILWMNTWLRTRLLSQEAAAEEGAKLGLEKVGEKRASGGKPESMI